MRTITYKCDRCGKPVTGRGVTKINANIQRGMDGTEKKSYDFCSTCFLIIKRSFARSLSMDESMEDITKPVQSEPLAKPACEVPSPAAITEEPVVVSEPAASENGLKLGPISKEEKDEILRLFVETNLNADQIAAKMNRLPRGIKRAFNSAAKSGELDRLKEAFAEKKRQAKAAEEAVEEDLSEKNIGSGASNAGIVRDGYTAAPKTEVINGKRYDVGGILALHNAGWGLKMIADERHYDQDVVRIIIEKYN